MVTVLWGGTPRIAYTREEEANVDAMLLERVGVAKTSVLFYKKANEYCVYIHRPEWKKFDRLIAPHSMKAQRRFTL